MNTKNNTKLLIGVTVGMVIGLVLIMLLVITGLSRTIYTQNQNYLKATCLEEFATIECLDKRIKGYQLRKELKLQIEAHKKND